MSMSLAKKIGNKMNTTSAITSSLLKNKIKLWQTRGICYFTIISYSNNVITDYIQDSMYIIALLCAVVTEVLLLKIMLVMIWILLPDMWGTHTTYVHFTGGRVGATLTAVTLVSIVSSIILQNSLLVQSLLNMHKNSLIVRSSICYTWLLY